MTIDTLNISGLIDNMESVNQAYVNKDNASDTYESSGKKGLDYSELDPQPVIFTPMPAPQTNRIDTIPFIVTMKWYESLLMFPPGQEQRAAGQKFAKKKGIKLNDDGIALDTFVEIPFHRFADGDSGDAVCLREAFGSKCPHCERMFAEYKKRNEGDPEAEEVAKSLKISWRTFCNIYNHNFQSNPNAPEDHDGYEIIDDIGRGSLLANIYEYAKMTDSNAGMVYPWSHPEHGYTLLFDSVWKKPTSTKYKNGHFDFPIVKFEKRPDDVSYVQDIEESVRFDVLIDKLIYSYDIMHDMMIKKVGEDKCEHTGQMENQNLNHDQQTQDNSPGINQIPEQHTGTAPDGEKIDDQPAISNTAAGPGRRGRRSRTDSPAQDTQSSEPAGNDSHIQQETARTRRRARR